MVLSQKDAARKKIFNKKNIPNRPTVKFLRMLPESHLFFSVALVAFLRLGQPMPFSSSIPYCNYGVELDEEGYHLLTCKLGQALYGT